MKKEFRRVPAQPQAVTRITVDPQDRARLSLVLGLDARPVTSEVVARIANSPLIETARSSGDGYGVRVTAVHSCCCHQAADEAREILNTCCQPVH